MKRKAYLALVSMVFCVLITVSMVGGVLASSTSYTVSVAGAGLAAVSAPSPLNVNGDGSHSEQSLSAADASSPSNPGFDAGNVLPVSSPLVVETKYGLVQGMEWDNYTYAWLGIPYAKPPVGELRWKAPQDPEPWSGVRNATEFSEPPIQFAGYMGAVNEDDIVNARLIGSEDCLYLNIWVPKAEDGGLPENLPVYVWVYGGANIAGQGSWPLYWGANLARKANVVVVTFNYRVGIAGWFYHPALKTGDPLNDSGNYALLDIIKACEWVRENIKNFGGNPDLITIAGESAGGVNIYSLLTSPYVKQEYFDKGNPLFHRAVIQSAGIIPLPKEVAVLSAYNLLVKLLVKQGVADDTCEALEMVMKASDEQIKSWLMETPMEELYEALRADGEPPSLLAMPSSFMDGYVIAKNPYLRLIKGEYVKVPVIIGCCKEEIKYMMSEMFCDPELYRNVTFGHYIPENISEYLDYIRPWPDELAPYLDWVLVGAYDLIAKAGSKVWEIVGVDIPAYLMSLHQRDVYVYRFCWNQEPKPLDLLVGACHGSDIAFIFGNVGEGEGFPLCNLAWTKENEPGRRALSDAMIAYWSNFMRYGNPGDPDGGCLWWEGLPDWDNYRAWFGCERIIFDATNTRAVIYMVYSIL
ncbi:MAG: carboxylesterase/lipase family protein [Candidatus Freyarchaeota archaeon]